MFGEVGTWPGLLCAEDTPLRRSGFDSGDDCWALAPVATSSTAMTNVETNLFIAASLGSVDAPQKSWFFPWKVKLNAGESCLSAALASIRQLSVCGTTRSMCLSDAFDHDRSTVSEHLSDALHDFSRVVARAKHRIGSQFTSMLQHQIKSLAACLLTQIR